MGSLTNFDPLFLSEVFIETGTFYGDTLYHAMLAGYPTLHSIEFYEPNYLKAKERFADAANVYLHLGSSPDVLPRLMDPMKFTTFWLDAHFQNRVPEEEDARVGECPLMLELDVIANIPWMRLPIILIDDAHMFDDRISAGFDRNEWPNIETIKAALPGDYIVQERENDYLACLPRTLIS